MNFSQQHDRAHWQEIAENKVPSIDVILERSHAIATEYAGWYRSNPDFFQWAGMAVFASRGKRFLAWYERRHRQLESQERRSRDRSLRALGAIRDASNLIYRDLGWILEAYPREDFDDLERILDALPHHELILEALRLLHEAEVEVQKGSAPADVEVLTAKATGLFLRHEQMYLVQPQLEKVGPFFRILFSLALDADFSSDPNHRAPARHSHFFTYMLAHGMGLLLKTRSLPNITRFEHRWFWMENAILPMWREVRRAPDFDEMLQRILDDVPPRQLA